MKDNAPPPQLAKAWATAFAGIAMLLAAQPARADADEFLLVPRERAGIVTAKATRQLLELLGATTVTETHGTDTGPVTTLYPGTDNEIKIFWPERNNDFTRPDMACVFQRAGKLSSWHTREGIRLGSSLQELEKISGEPIVFSGFGGDTGGRVIDGLTLDMMLALRPQEGVAVDGKYEGENLSLSSDDPGLQRLGIHVSEICIAFDE